MALTIPVVYGSTRAARQGIKAARFIVRSLEARGHEAPLIDPMEYTLPLLDKRSVDYESADAMPAMIRELSTLYRRSDGFVFVTGEYNALPPPALKNLIDHFVPEYAHRPAAVVSYSGGPFGGMRAATALLGTILNIGAVPIPARMPIPQVQDQFEADGTPKDKDAWEKRAAGFLSTLEWYAEALRRQREAKGAP